METIVATLPIFSQLSEPDLKILLSHFELQEKPKGSVIYVPGDVRDRLRVLLEGCVEVIAAHGQAEETSTIYGPRQFFNESAILRAQTTHTARAVALKDCRFAVLKRASFEEMTQKHPLVAAKIVASLGEHIYQRALGSGTHYFRPGFASSQTRIEHDLLGDKPIPSDAYFGVQTLRAKENFHITGVTLRDFPVFIRSFAEVKKAAALANHRLGLLSPEVLEGISMACDEIVQGHWHDQFVVDMIQGGAGTSTNMNVNEVVANRALELMGHCKGEYHVVHPNNHVNLGQSTNDAYPTAVRIAALHAIPNLTSALTELCSALGDKARQFQDVIKMGRTQLQDAVPMTLGQEFEAFRVTMEEDIMRIQDASKLFLEVNMGGTAIGTGINAHPDYPALVVSTLREVTGLPVVASANLIEATPDTGSFVLFSGILKRLAVKLSKICNDLRLLSSGPRCGLGEINLPPQQPGSSIMPGKVNPVIPEVVNQVAFQVIGNDLTITMAAEHGQLQLNVMEPVIVFNLFQSVVMLSRAIRTLTEQCVRGITANREVCRRYVENSIGLVTALNPYIGYENSTRIAQEALQTGDSVFNLVLKHGLMSRAQLEDVLKPENMLGFKK